MVYLMMMSVAKMPYVTFRNELFLYDEEVLAPCPTIKLVENLLSAVRNFYSVYSQLRVRIATGYGLESPGSIPGSATFSLLHSVQTGTHPASYTVSTRGSFPGSKAAGA
jgi:hypothetical protein